MTPKELDELSRQPRFSTTAMELIRIAGLEAAAKLITAWPGQEFPVPQCTKEGHNSRRRFDQLARVVGTDAARRIVAHFGGQKLYIPSCKMAITASNNARLRAEYDQMTGTNGLTHPEAVFGLGISYGICGRAVERILKRDP